MAPVDYDGPAGNLTGDQALLWLNDRLGDVVRVSVARAHVAVLDIKGVLRRPSPDQATADSVGYFIGDGGEGELTLPLPFSPATCEVIDDLDWVELSAVMDDGTTISVTIGEVV